MTLPVFLMHQSSNGFFLPDCNRKNRKDVLFDDRVKKTMYTLINEYDQYLNIL